MSADDFPFLDEFQAQIRKVKAELNLQPGDIYEDCSFHPVLCIGIDYEEDSVWGVSLIDGSQPRSCSLRLCGVRKLTPEDAWKIKQHGPVEQKDREFISSENRWW